MKEHVRARTFDYEAALDKLNNSRLLWKRLAILLRQEILHYQEHWLQDPKTWQHDDFYGASYHLKISCAFLGTTLLYEQVSEVCKQISQGSDVEMDLMADLAQAAALTLEDLEETLED